MNSSSYDPHTPPDITHMSETILDSASNQALVTTNDIDILNDVSNFSSEPNENIPFESSPTVSSKKQKSLLSVYDNSNDGEQHKQQQQQFTGNLLPVVGILGRNHRSQAFTRRLLLSGFPKPVLCDTNSNTNDSNYVSYQTFYERCPTVVLITDNLPTNFDYIFNPTKPQLIVDTREVISNYRPHQPSQYLMPIPDAYRAFGNISNWEIEYGTERLPVAIEQSSPIELVQFILKLNCFSRGISFIDPFSYNNIQRKSFRNCLFPLVTTIIIFTLSFLFAMIEYNHQRNYYREQFIYRYASSITATTSITLLSVLFLLSPIVESINLINSLILKKQDILPSRWMFLHRWNQSKRYLAWYSLGFGILHLIFLFIAKNDFNRKIFFFFPVIFGLFALIVLCILSFVYFPWISERLQWREYYILTSHFGPFCLVIAFIHVYIQWKYGYEYLHQQDFFRLRFISMILPFFVLTLRFTLHGIIHPLLKWFHSRERRNKATATDTSFSP
ncbi:unnamed protein product [Adineta ricciae]|uniref:Uncharacterized protein n=1 Tax=Adineta ricciae TaxID=249248 RepID=A0A816EUG2_ADIRI|nr:unnamed protein product [Adineta ricciae]CAF1654403.1 unnamed protein product [Adineta ricciae]